MAHIANMVSDTIENFELFSNKSRLFIVLYLGEFETSLSRFRSFLFPSFRVLPLSERVVSSRSIIVFQIKPFDCYLKYFSVSSTISKLCVMLDGFKWNTLYLRHNFSIILNNLWKYCSLYSFTKKVNRTHHGQIFLYRSLYNFTNWKINFDSTEFQLKLLVGTN